MDNNGYLIPANSKKSMLILGFFTPTDLIIFIAGVVISFFLLLILNTQDLKQAIVILLPACVAAFLLIPIPNHHNIRTFFINVYHYFSSRKSYYWRGWCINHGEE